MIPFCSVAFVLGIHRFGLDAYAKHAERRIPKLIAGNARAHNAKIVLLLLANPRPHGMRILRLLSKQFRRFKRPKPVLLRSDGIVLGILNEPNRPRKSGLQESDYLLATGGRKLPNGDIDCPNDVRRLKINR